jgi:hypothetical protein
VCAPLGSPPARGRRVASGLFRHFQVAVSVLRGR